MTKIREKHGYYRDINSQELHMVSIYSYILAFLFILDVAEMMEASAPNA
ncbi:hypothetical protein AJ81_06625 [Pseudothermotoga hypogea DSM 11164 = NBRC 106472]|uniref:Uncharacterized protein n=1 Tax=Pseudothermotoga hypogea DSM 11164 = NBRC 106472 TaxID=1123384 RepID=A0A0X1KUC3_9THEM|nr:hypothetical protein [Pseudothermotoga hypogea]AJC74796.1 hypothetical protein AJ81_06625 [Pseudothermotoga hypogea DSM 11164 = NBRC 106472]